jgi:hypothetical protein
MCFDPISATLVAAGVEAGAAAAAAPYIASGVAAAGTGLTLYGQATTAEANADIARANAQHERQAGLVEQERLEDRRRHAVARATTVAAAAGVDPSRGSAALVIQETDRNSMLDVATALWNRNSAATAFDNKANALEAEAAGTRFAAPFAVGGQFLTGAARARALRINA